MAQSRGGEFAGRGHGSASVGRRVLEQISPDRSICNQSIILKGSLYPPFSSQFELFATGHDEDEAEWYCLNRVEGEKNSLQVPVIAVETGDKQ